jgi:hypothetical protein
MLVEAASELDLFQRLPVQPEPAEVQPGGTVGIPVSPVRDVNPARKSVLAQRGMGELMSRSRLALAACVVVAVLLLASCAAGPNNVAQVNAAHIAGFWQGLWQGLISPIAFLVSLFNGKVSIYEVHNNGNWYNFGFMIGVSATFSGIGRSGASAGPRRRPAS